MTRIYNAARLLLLALFLSACSNISQQPVNSNQDLDLATSSAEQQARQALLIPHSKWRMRGKIGLRSPQQNGSGFIDWQQDGEQFRLQVSGPLGQGSTVIAGNKHELSIQGEEVINNPQAQAEQALGWPLPQQQMPYWVRGLAAPDESSQSEWSEGLLQKLQQGGWEIEYLRYSRHRIPLPEKLKLKRGNIQLTLVVKRWQ
ncbi:lipoprotein insertase outer membrane protein LolB [uncultured Pseudoteredinibacter sp.]|uniref:lipoprotein insertase outer membrane protein LolB n=1 Tax=uncultured Pseudoteredinibacter sp. TaxID=1641701 RepID=UPI00261F0ECA|nr:lipoprotein insertase outer membrane protein LolB [uncultured Pseudoteredinibacter sp.]